METVRHIISILVSNLGQYSYHNKQYKWYWWLLLVLGHRHSRRTIQSLIINYPSTITGFSPHHYRLIEYGNGVQYCHAVQLATNNHLSVTAPTHRLLITVTQYMYHQ